MKILVLIIYIAAAFIWWKALTKPAVQVLGQAVSPTPTILESPSSTPTPTPTVSPTPIITPKPTPKPTLRPSAISSQEVNGLIDRFAAQYAVDPNVLRHVAICESGFKSNAVNGDYVGLFQFGPTTWKNNRKLMGEDVDLNLRFNAEESIQTGAYLISKGKSGIWPNCFPK